MTRVKDVVTSSNTAHISWRDKCRFLGVMQLYVNFFCEGIKTKGAKG